jgi:tripartite ATP-independent transporter DctM subunit
MNHNSSNTLTAEVNDVSSPPLKDSKLHRPAETALEMILAFILFAELFVLFGNVVMREIFNQSFAGTGEVASLALAALAFIGGAIAYDKGEHISVRVIIEKLPEKWIYFFDALRNWIVIAMAIISLVQAFPLIKSHWHDVTPVLQLPKGWVFASFVVGMCLLVIFAVKQFTRLSLRIVLISCAAIVGLFFIWYLAQSMTGPWDGSGGLLLIGIMLFLLIGIGVPIGFILPMAAYLYLMSSQTADISAIPVAMIDGVSGFVMLAIPFFILAGYIMTEGGLAKHLADWAYSIMGHVRGGLLYVLVVSMFIFSGISGSKVADVAAVGTSLRDMLKAQGYKPAEYSALLGASAIMGETIPPSIGLLVLGSITTLPIGAFFVAGVIPAVLMALCLAIFIFFRARAKQWPKGEKVSWGKRMWITLRAIPVLMIPLMLIVGIAGGIATPTEVSSFAVLYSIIIALLAYKSMRVRALMKIFANTGVVAGMILFIISAGSAFSWTLTIADLPQFILNFLNSTGGSKTLFLLLTLIVLIIMGGLLEGLPALLVFGPMLLPITHEFGIDSMHYGIILIIAMGMGSFLPPFGVGFYVSCSIGESTMEEVVPRYIPYIMILLVGLILITFFPWFSLALPKALHLLK